MACRCHRTARCARSQRKQICQAKAQVSCQLSPIISHRLCRLREHVLILQDDAVSRRDVALAGFAALLAVPAGSAQAGLLGGTDKNEIYTQDTVSYIAKLACQKVCALRAMQTSSNDTATLSEFASFQCPVTVLQSMLLDKVKNGLELPKDASNREEVFQDIKDKTTKWVAKYRREGSFQGRPSYRQDNQHA